MIEKLKKITKNLDPDTKTLLKSTRDVFLLSLFITPIGISVILQIQLVFKIHILFSLISVLVLFLLDTFVLKRENILQRAGSNLSTGSGYASKALIREFMVAPLVLYKEAFKKKKK